MDETLVLSGAATLLIDDNPVGFTRDGVRITPTLATRDIEADQAFSPILIRYTSRGIEVSTSLLEITLENMRQMWNEEAEVDGGPPGTSLVLGKISKTPRRLKLVFYGEREDGKFVKFTVPKCTAVTLGEAPFVKDGEFLLTATFRALHDTDLDGFAKAEIVEAP